MSVAEALHMRVYVDQARMKMMMCYDWTEEERARLTTDASATVMMVVPMNCINFQSIEAVLRKRTDCTRVVAFQPTGWTHTTTSGCSSSSSSSSTTPQRYKLQQMKLIQYSTKPHHHHHHQQQQQQQKEQSNDATLELTPRCKGHNKIYAVPYSEHSSFGELVDFIKIFR